jgi:glycosyltransferase involved in cell wall biosynthesis
VRVAFYAPLKPPDDPVPSGDRRMARLLMHALACGGHRAEIAARLRSRDSLGDPARQLRLAALGRRLAARAARRFLARPPAERPDAWLTYHLYYRAPDWIGPAASAQLGIPYLVVEPSHAPKRSGGPWDLAHKATEAALRMADGVLCMTAADAACVAPLVALPDRLHRLRPFVEVAPFAAAAEARAAHRSALAARHGLDPDRPWLLTVAMMRRGDKLDSYRVLARALSQVEGDWQLVVAGDGPARPAVEEALGRFADGRVQFLGLLDAEALPPLYAASDLFVWPALREAYGMAFLEAQAAGLPVVGGADGGVAEVVYDGETGRLTPPGNARAFAAALKSLLDDAPARRRLSETARRYMAENHDLSRAAKTLDRALAQAVATRP